MLKTQFGGERGTIFLKKQMGETRTAFGSEKTRALFGRGLDDLKSEGMQKQKKERTKKNPAEENKRLKKENALLKKKIIKLENNNEKLFREARIWKLVIDEEYVLKPRERRLESNQLNLKLMELTVKSLQKLLKITGEGKMKMLQTILGVVETHYIEKHPDKVDDFIANYIKIKENEIKGVKKEIRGMKLNVNWLRKKILKEREEFGITYTLDKKEAPDIKSTGAAQ